MRARRWWAVVVFPALVMCGGDESPVASSAVEPVQTTAPAPAPTAAAPTAAVTTTVPGCLRASSAFAGRLSVASAAAVKETVPTKPGLNRKGSVWFVSTRDGATWVTNADPTVDESGLTYPLNAKARATSEVGADVPAGSPVLEGLTDASAGAVRSRACAA